MEILVSIAAIIVILALLPYAMPVLGSILLFILMPFAKLFAWIGAILFAIIAIPLALGYSLSIAISGKAKSITFAGFELSNLKCIV